MRKNDRTKKKKLTFGEYYSISQILFFILLK
jgi:hypothetical protein